MKKILSRINCPYTIVWMTILLTGLLLLVRGMAAVLGWLIDL